MVIGAEGAAPCGSGRGVAGEAGAGCRSPAVDDWGCTGCSPAGGVAPAWPGLPDEPSLLAEVAVDEAAEGDDDFLREDPERFPEVPELFLAVLLEEASADRDPFLLAEDDFEDDDLPLDLAVEDPEDEG